MLHIYRQITALKRCAPVVIAQKREQTERFPFEPVQIVPKPATHFVRRFWFRQVRDMPWQISDAELRALLRLLSRTDARLLHIYFGQIAVHLLPLIRTWKNPSIVSFHGADVTVDMNKPAYRESTRQMLDAVKLVLVRSESLRRALNIKIRVSFTGFISHDQLRDIYYRTHIFVHPSQTGRDGNVEGIPNSMLEAMASGLPVFATDHGGIPEAVENGVSGVLVRERDHEALANALLNATQDSDSLARIARNGAEVVRKNFDLQAQAQRLEEIYLRLIG